jgi:hypothetical protein
MDINSKFQVTVWGVLGVIGSTAVVVAGATWGVAKTTESNELQAYQAAKDWKAAEAIVALKELSESVKLKVDEQNELNSLRQRVPKLESTLSQTKAELEAATAEVSSLRLVQSSLVKNIDEVQIPLGQSRFLIPNTVAVGVVSIMAGFNTCSVRIAERSTRLEVGEPTRLSFANKSYVLTLLAVTDTACSFSFAEAIP